MTYLTLEELKKRTKGYSSRSQLSRLDQSAYRSAKAQGLLDELLPSLGMPARLTDEEIGARAAAYPNRTAFKRFDNSGFEIAKRRGLLEMLFPKTIKEPKAPRVKRVKRVRPYQPRHTKRKNREMTIEVVRELSKTYRSRSHMQDCDPSLYQSVKKFGLMIELFPGSLRSADEDAFYMKRATGEVFNGLPVYKVGITSARLGDARIKSQCRKSRMKHQLVIPSTRMIGCARDVELFALGLGVDPKYLPFDGSTEYRAFTEDEVQQIKDMVEMCRA